MYHIKVILIFFKKVKNHKTIKDLSAEFHLEIFFFHFKQIGLLPGVK